MSGKQLSPEMVVELKAAFTVFDTNGDGFITREELLTMFNGLALEVDPGFQLVVDEMIKVADVNGDGKIDFNEFIAMAGAN